MKLPTADLEEAVHTTANEFYHVLEPLIGEQDARKQAEWLTTMVVTRFIKEWKTL